MVSVIWSLTNGGTSLSDTVDHGDKSNGETSDAEEIFIRHDGLNPITSVGLYIKLFEGTYGGSFSALSDLNEILSWGSNALGTADGFGGFQVNLNATGSYPTVDWPTYLVKEPTNGFVHYTGVGDSSATAKTLPIVTGASIAGQVQAGSAPNVRFKARIQIPVNEDTAGIRQFTQALTYSYTS